MQTGETVAQSDVARDGNGDALTGGCQCGAVRYRAAAPLAAYACHCTECQAQSASAFGVSVVVEARSLAIDGQTASWVRDEGRPTAARCTFCPRCGTRVLHAREGADRVTLKGGSLDRRAWLVPDGHIWLRSAAGWVREIIGATTRPDDLLEGQPDDYRALIDRWAARGRARETLLGR